MSLCCVCGGVVEFALLVLGGSSLVAYWRHRREQRCKAHEDE